MVLGLVLAGRLLAGPGGLEVGLTPAKVPQGGVFLVAVEGAGEVRPTGSLGARRLGFFRKASGGWEALAGVDLELAPGQHPVEVAVGAKKARAELTVVAGKYAVERLKLPAGKASPQDKAQEARVAAEQKRAREAGLAYRDAPFAGVLAIPCAGRLDRTSFGSRRIINGVAKSPHGGTDVKAPAGTPVRAAAAGVVRLVDDMFYSGKSVFLDHGCGWMTTYFHLSTVKVRAGDELTAGQELGQVGATGRATGPHLHWGLQWLRARVDPLILVVDPVAP